MRYIALISLLLALGGCATPNLSIERRGACSVLKQAGYSASVAIEASHVKWLNAGPPAMTNVFSIALEPTDQDKEAGIVAMYLDLGGGGVVESCQRILDDQYSCIFGNSALAAAGFNFRLIGTSKTDPQSVLVRGKSYWSTVSACKPDRLTLHSRGTGYASPSISR